MAWPIVSVYCSLFLEAECSSVIYLFKNSTSYTHFQCHPAILCWEEKMLVIFHVIVKHHIFQNIDASKQIYAPALMRSYDKYGERSIRHFFLERTILIFTTCLSITLSHSIPSLSRFHPLSPFHASYPFVGSNRFLHLLSYGMSVLSFMCDVQYYLQTKSPCSSFQVNLTFPNFG